MTPAARPALTATGIDLRFDPDTQLHVLSLASPDPESEPLQVLLAMDPMDLLSQLDEIQGEVTIFPEDLRRIRTRLFDEILADATANADLIDSDGSPADPAQITRLQFGCDSWDNGYFPSSSTLRMFYGADGGGEVTVELDEERDFALESIDERGNDPVLTQAHGNSPTYGEWELVLYRDGIERSRY